MNSSRILRIYALRKKAARDKLFCLLSFVICTSDF